LDGRVGVEGCGLESVFFHKVGILGRGGCRVLGLASGERVPARVPISMAMFSGVRIGNKTYMPMSRRLGGDGGKK
jgi:hypothetical protein